MTHSVRRIGALIAITAAALFGLAAAQTTNTSTGTRADSVWRVAVTPTTDETDQTAPADEPAQDAPVAAPQDSVW